MLALLVLLCCGEPVLPPPTPTVLETQPVPAPRRTAPRVDLAHWTQRTDLELAQALTDTCRASVADGRPILFEFSAPWCLDCRTLATLEDHPALQTEYGNWHRIRADVGKFDRHLLFLQAWKVDAIAHWVAMKPTDCATQPPDWPRLAEGTLELATGKAGPRNAAEVVGWLQQARGTP